MSSIKEFNNGGIVAERILRCYTKRARMEGIITWKETKQSKEVS
jgi:hypothetical protein